MRQALIKKMRDMHPYVVEMEKIAAKRGITIRAPRVRRSGPSLCTLQTASDTSSGLPISAIKYRFFRTFRIDGFF
ncbi:hypothetical protein DAA51_38915 [Bradyrhizobium sp. WBAH10]|nr:hypothetical protein [Bradyrhizobium sp. CCBAU 11357]MDD1523395.1 hypothetical protein [Bradyrhizobium sp. WBAH30]MDD1547709.1 hypothetical protein [Bradyrhizobium sp. WBAH41]MDD1561361.1 hypothetical protein [Bradyrhizobium sp. WBAH23]MDD1567330.1 hypothetical protein [Bradyrhizobium sp. WBAH33]MDD1594761.1 hypothetical protein [Bradyrhizobium sp. WBAH42]NRB92305.1 hypothetical protein [Bradyrhizobium sp. WBAH10]QCJ87367.1 hypothetical protein DAA57_01670 [Bradyrhizobium yuanmingense]